jgi:hypothetical protein
VISSNRRRILSASALWWRVNQPATHDQIICQMVSKGFELLRDEKVARRLGGIYALEGVMNSSEQYHQAALEALCAFVRDGAKARLDSLFAVAL